MNAVVIQIPVQSDIDVMGQLKAQIDALQKQYDALADSYRTRAPGRYDGDLFAVTVSDETLVETFDAKQAKAKLVELGVDQQWIAGCTKVSVRKPTVKVVAR